MKQAATAPAPVTCDWHIHSCHSCDCKTGAYPSTMADLVAEIEACGVLDYGITDHIHTPFNLPDLEASRKAFDALPPNPRRHFAVEVSSVSQWEIDEVANGTRQNPVYGIRSGGPVAAELALALTADDITRLGIEYVIGGTHWPMYVPFEREAIIRDYHRQNIFLLTHPLTNIIAHPWWWMGHWQNPETKMYTAEPWFDDFNVIPTSMHDEFIAAARQYGKIVEVNNNAMLASNSYPEKFKQQYCEFLAAVKGAGVPLSFGSDHHSQHQIYTESACRGGSKSFISSAARLAAVGITDADFWRLPPRKV